MFHVMSRQSRATAGVMLSAALALTGTTGPAGAADYFWGLTGSYSGGPYISADGSTVIFNRSSGGPAVWGANGLSTLAGPVSVSALSADGTVIAGFQSNLPMVWRGSIATELKPLVPGYSYGSIRAISADGRYAVGNLPTGGPAPDLRPVIWDTITGIATDIGDTPLGTNYGHATAISDDGKVVVGYNWTSTREQVFRWENGTRFDLPGLYSQNLLLSGNGQVITTSSGGWRWIGGANGHVVTGITYLPGATGAQINAISYDGQTVIGYAVSTAMGVRPMRWTDGVGTDLGTLGYSYGSALDMSADTKIVVGFSYDAALKSHAVRWDDTGGIRKVSDMLANGGVDVTGWTLDQATRVSDDGTMIVGTGISGGTGGYWLARCGDVCSAFVSPDVLAASYAGLGALGATASTYIGTELNAGGDMAAAASPGAITGFAYGAFDSDPTTSATVGASVDLGDDLTVVGSFGAAGIETLLPYGGVARFSGPAATVALVSRPETGLNWMIGGSLVGLTGTVERGYLNGNTPVRSTGSTSGGGGAISAELGWSFEDLIAETLVTPFVAVTVSSVSYAGYTETAGPFPATFQPFTTGSGLLRLGAEFRREFVPGTYVTAGISYGHNFGDGGVISAATTGLSLAVPGAMPVSDFIEASIGIDLPLTETVDFASRVAAILPLNGAPASIQARAGISMSY